MTKPELVTVIAHKTGQSKAVTERMLSALTDVITEELVHGGDVRIVDFGKFYSKHKDAYKMDNHLTGEEISVKSKVVAKFAPAKALKDKLNA